MGLLNFVLIFRHGKRRVVYDEEHICRIGDPWCWILHSYTLCSSKLFYVLILFLEEIHFAIVLVSYVITMLVSRFTG